METRLLTLNTMKFTPDDIQSSIMNDNSFIHIMDDNYSIVVLWNTTKKHYNICVLYLDLDTLEACCEDPSPADIVAHITTNFIIGCKSINVIADTLDSIITNFHECLYRE